MNVSSIYEMFFLKISWLYACMKQHEASSPHPRVLIFPVQHKQDSGLTVLERDGYQGEFYYEMIALQMWVSIKVYLRLLCGVQHSVIMADLIKHERQQLIIVIILIIYFPDLSKDLVEL